MESKFKVGDKVRHIFDLTDVGEVKEVVSTGDYQVQWQRDGYMSHKEDVLELLAVEGVPTTLEEGKQVFDSGAQRDTQEGKPRYDLIDPLLLRRVADHLTIGAAHYGEYNWTKGIPSSRYMASLLRHVEAHRDGKRDEDHLAAVVFNVMGIMRNEGTSLDDLFDWSLPND